MTELRALFEAVYRSQPEEHAFAVTSVEGTLPAELSGTFLRSGPGLLEVGRDAMGFFDGHALVCGVSFHGGRASFRSRFVRTPLYEQETSRRRLVRRRIFTNLPSRWSNFLALDLGNSAMHDVYVWGEGDARRLVAANDPGHFALDARTLATKGREDWSGAVPKGHEMAPMPHEDPHTGRLVAWIKKVGRSRPDQLKFVELDGSFRVVAETPFASLGASPVVVHDQGASKKWYVTVEQSVRLSPLQAMWGAVSAYDAFKTPPGATAALLLVRRDGDQRLVRVPLPSPHELAFHVINCFDEGERLVVDVCAYAGRIRFDQAGPPAFRAKASSPPSHGPRPTPVRFVVDPEAGRIVETRRLGDLPFDAPALHAAYVGRPYRYAYSSTLASADGVPDAGNVLYFDALAKLDVEAAKAEVWRAPSALVSLCSFVPRPGATAEDDGWLLAWLLDERSTKVAVLDAQRLAAGPVATLDLGVHLPGVSHVRWAPGLELEA